MTYREQLNEMTRTQLVTEAVLVWDMHPNDTDNFTTPELVEWCLGRDEEHEARFSKGKIR